jgi:hypothetical protein
MAEIARSFVWLVKYINISPALCLFAETLFANKSTNRNGARRSLRRRCDSMAGEAITNIQRQEVCRKEAFKRKKGF